MAASRSPHLTRGALAAALAAATLLAGCGEHHAAPAQEASAPVARPDALAGAPADAPTPPPVEAPPAIVPPPPAATYPPPPRPGDRDVIYDLGPVRPARDTMAPIPNPPETQPLRHVSPVRRMHAHRHFGHFGRAALRAHHGRRAAMSASAHPAAPALRTAPAPHNAAHAHPAATVKPTPAARDAVPLAAKPAAGKAPVAAKPAATGERAVKLQALQGALKDALARTAVLNTPELKAGQPADVTLTLPADFASTVREEAGKQGLQDAAASVNMTALLSGDGYAVAPDETQSQPLTVGQPTEFHWTVTAQPGAKGGVHADVGADLLGGGDDALQLGSVSAAAKAGQLSPRFWGAGLLVLLAVAVLVWLGRRNGDAAARRRRNGLRPAEARPLDMGVAPPPPPPADPRY